MCIYIYIYEIETFACYLNICSAHEITPPVLSVVNNLFFQCFPLHVSHVDIIVCFSTGVFYIVTEYI